MGGDVAVPDDQVFGRVDAVPVAGGGQPGDGDLEVAVGADAVPAPRAQMALAADGQPAEAIDAVIGVRHVHHAVALHDDLEPPMPSMMPATIPPALA